MPKTKSAKKAHLQSQKRHLKNIKAKKEVKKALKLAMKSLEEKKSKQAPEKVKAAIILIDKADKNNIIHKNKAARLKSRLVKKLNELRLNLPNKTIHAKIRKKIKSKKSALVKTTKINKTKMQKKK